MEPSKVHLNVVPFHQLMLTTRHGELPFLQLFFDPQSYHYLTFALHLLLIYLSNHFHSQFSAFSPRSASTENFTLFRISGNFSKFKIKYSIFY